MKAKTLLFMGLLFVLLDAAIGEVVVFNDYVTHTTLKDDRLLIEREITLKNVGKNPIIPGELHFKLHEIKKNERVPSVVRDFKAQNDYQQELKTRTIEGREETDLVISVWEPVLPQFSYRIKLSYELEFKTKGLLFYELNVPLEETSIPIRNNRHNLYIPSGYHVTYAPNAVVSSVSRNQNAYEMVSWENRESMVIEYSRLPLPKMGIRAVNIFWGVVIVSMILLTFLIHRKMKNI